MACTAFVFGGGGLLGACEAGMALALLEHGVAPDLVVGTSVGAINGAAVAADSSPAGARRLVEMWRQITIDDLLAGTVLGRLGRLARYGTHLHANEPLRKLLTQTLPVTRFDALAVRFECVAASIERAEEHWFTEGELVPAVLASAALPGVLPPVEIDGEHFLDGGLVNSIPIARALACGAGVVYVLHVGRVEEPLVAPQRPWDVAFVAFEIAGVIASTPTFAPCRRTSRSMSCPAVRTPSAQPRGPICATATYDASTAESNAPTKRRRVTSRESRAARDRRPHC